MLFRTVKNVYVMNAISNQRKGTEFGPERVAMKFVKEANDFIVYDST